MVSREARHLLVTLGGLVALGALPGSGFPQFESERDPADDEERIADAIVAAQAVEGPRSPAQIQLLTELGVLYETEGRHTLATTALEQARQLVRENYGLYTLEQVPLLQQALANQQALGNLAMVQAIEEELLGLAERHRDDLRTVTIHRDAGRRRLDILRRLLAGEAPGEVYPETGFYSFFKDDVIMELVSDAQIHSADAAAVILRNGLYSSDELRDLEMEIVRASDLLRQRSLPSRHSLYSDYDDSFYNAQLEGRTNALSHLAGFPAPQGEEQRLLTDGMTSLYEVGRESYRRLIAYDDMAFGSAAEEAALRSRLEAYLRLADWDLIYSKNGAALDQYARVHELLTTTDFAKPLIAAIFAPPIPTVLPTFVANPLETLASARYIDVAFEVTRFGESRRIEIVSAAPNVSDAAKKELAALIRDSRFRPRVVDGELARVSPVAVRYYLN